MSSAAALDLKSTNAIVLNDSNRLVLRLMPCDVVARVAPMAYQGAAGEPWCRPRSRACSTARRDREPGELLLSLAWSHASTSVTASRSRCGPTTNLCRLESSRQPTTRTRSSACMPACGRSMSRRRTSWIESRTLNKTLRAATSLRSSPTRTGSFSQHAAKLEAVDRRPGRRRAAAARRAAPVERAQH